MVLRMLTAPIFEGEAEMAVIIGKRAPAMFMLGGGSEDTSLDTPILDGSAARLPRPATVFFQMKSATPLRTIGP